MHGGGPYNIETSPFVGNANQWTGFRMIGATVMKEFEGSGTYCNVEK